MKVLVTGGCGYIGSHTIVDLLEHGYQVICMDNNIRSDCSIHEKIRSLTGKEAKHYTVDLTDKYSVKQVFLEHQDISAVFHFAALKSVAESLQYPMSYYKNNGIGMIHLLDCMDEFLIPYFIFSSSCTVYGNPINLPVTETTPLRTPTSPYGATKQICEQMLHDFISAHSHTTKACSLRYFNPAGAHPSLQIGENTNQGVQSLTSAIVSCVKQTKAIPVYGFDYTTQDGSCARDFIHVCDIARAHRLALEHLQRQSGPTYKVYNLGSGQPRTVLEAIRVFSSIYSGFFEIDLQSRRAGDIEAIYADCSLAKQELQWEPQYSLEDILRTAWDFECQR